MLLIADSCNWLQQRGGQIGGNALEVQMTLRKMWTEDSGQTWDWKI